MIILFHIYILNSIFVTFLLAMHKSPISSPYIHTSLVDQMVKNLHAVSPGFDLFVRKTLWRREWLPIPVFFPGEFHGQRNLVGYSPWGCKELDMIVWLTLLLFIPIVGTMPFMVHTSFTGICGNDTT